VERCWECRFEQASLILEKYRKGELTLEEAKRGKGKKCRKVEAKAVAGGGSEAVVEATESDGGPSLEEQPKEERYVAICEEHGELTREEVFEDEIHGIRVMRCIYCGHIVRLLQP